MTIPVVPRIEMPPRMPSRGFSVFSAIISPSGTEISTSKSAFSPATSVIAAAIILRGTGLIAGSPGGMGRPGRVTRPTPGAARKGDARTGFSPPHRGNHQRPMRDVGIVAGVLDDAGHRFAVAQIPLRQREGDALPAGQRDLDRIGEFAGQKRGAGCLGRSGGAGAGGPAALQGTGFVVHAAIYRLAESPRHRRKRHA